MLVPSESLHCILLKEYQGLLALHHPCVPTMFRTNLKKNSKLLKTKIWTIIALDLMQRISAQNIYNPDLSKDKFTERFSSFPSLNLCCCVYFFKTQQIKWLTYKLVEVWMWECIPSMDIPFGKELISLNIVTVRHSVLRISHGKHFIHRAVLLVSYSCQGYFMEMI